MHFTNLIVLKIFQKKKKKKLNNLDGFNIVGIRSGLASIRLIVLRRQYFLN